MGVLDGQPVSAAITNPAFINKNQDDTMPNKLSFARALSGSSIDDIQAAVNKLYTATGASESQTGTVYDAPASTISDGDSHETALGKLADKFDPVTGHMHTGAAGDAPPIEGQFIINVPLVQLVVPGTSLSAVTGSTWDVTTELTGKTASTASTNVGVVVNDPYNKVLLANNQASLLTDNFVDDDGNLVYGRLTESSGTWTLSFYSLVFGVETAYSFTQQVNLNWYYHELFEPLTSTPVYTPDYFDFAFRTVKTIAASGFSPLFGDVTVAASGGVSVFQNGQRLTFTGSLTNLYPEDVAATGSVGIADEAARADHAHQGVHSVAATGNVELYGDVVIQAASGVTVTQSGQNILIDADHFESTPSPVTDTPIPGVSDLVSRGDHSHQGVHSVAASGQAQLFGDVVIQAASGVTVTQSGQNILVDADHYESTPSPVTDTPTPGTSDLLARGDHSHEGIHSIAVTGFSPLYGDVQFIEGDGIQFGVTGNTIEILSTAVGGVTSIAASGFAPATGNITLVAGSNITLTQVGTDITIASSGGGTTSPLTTKGDLYGYDTDNARVPVGASGSFLSADPNATLGVRYRDEYLRNYILEDDAEIGSTVGYATYADAAGTAPVDGTGGSPNVTIAVTGSNPISRSQSYLISKPASICQGQGVSYDFPIDNSLKGQVVEISFDYEPGTNWVASSGGTGFSDITMYMYDVTNSALIPIQPAVMTTGAGYVGTFVGTFQTLTTTASLRLIWHVATTNSNAWDFKFDNVRVGKPLRTQGTPITDWVTYTPTGNWNTNTTYKGRWRRVGDSMEILASVNLTGTPNSATFSINLPSGYTIDTTKLAEQSPAGAVGSASILDNGVQVYPAIAYFASSTSVNLTYGAANGAGVNTNNGVVNQANPTTFGSGDNIGISIRVPILGWSSQVEMSSEADTRVVAATYVISTGKSSSTTQPFDFDTKVFDTHAAVTIGSNWRFTAPVSGYYKVSTLVNPSAPPSLYLRLYKNGTFYSNLDYTVSTVWNGSITVQLNAGDYIDVRSSGASNSTGGSGENYISIERVSGPAAVAASETVAASYYASANNSPGANTQFNFDSKIFDSHNAVTTGASWRFSPPSSGTYCVEATWLQGSGTNFNMYLYKTGTIYKLFGSTSAANGNSYSGAVLVQLIAGVDYIDLRPSAAGTITGGAAPFLSFIDIHRIGF